MISLLILRFDRDSVKLPSRNAFIRDSGYIFDRLKRNRSEVKDTLISYLSKCTEIN